MPRARPRQAVSTTPPELLPDQVVEGRPTLEARLSLLDRGQLQTLVQTLAARQPNLIELIDEQLNLGGVAAPRSATRARRTTAAAVTAIRRQMRSLLRSCDYLGEATNGVLELAEQARPHLDAGDGNTALTILEAVTDEFVTGWTDLDDSDGDAEGLFDDLTTLWAEAILTANLTPAERQTWVERLADWHTEAAEYGIDAAFEAAQVAAVQGWDDPELQRMLRGEVASSESGTETAWAESSLASARLNILEHQGRLEEALHLADAHGAGRSICVAPGAPGPPGGGASVRPRATRASARCAGSGAGAARTWRNPGRTRDRRARVVPGGRAVDARDLVA
jgi:uncharacterized Zn finger protein